MRIHSKLCTEEKTNNDKKEATDFSVEKKNMHTNQS